MIDTKKAREMRAMGTAGEWSCSDDEPSDVCLWDKFGNWLANIGGSAVSLVGAVNVETGKVEEVVSFDQDTENGRLIAYAVNSLVPMADEIDRLTRREEKLVEETWNLGSELEPLRQRIAELESALAISRRAHGPEGEPPLPYPPLVLRDEDCNYLVPPTGETEG